MFFNLDSRRRVVLVVLAAVLALTSVGQAGDRPLTFEDLMKFRQIRDASISKDGAWMAYALVPDRGNGEAVVRSTTDRAQFRIARGSKPVISADGRWVAAAIAPTLEEREKARAKAAKKGGKKNDDDKPKNGLSLLDLRTGAEERIEKVEEFAFSDDGRWIAFKHYQVKKKHDEKSDEKRAEEEGEDKEDDEDKKDKPELGTTMKFRNLETGEDVVVEHVLEFVFADNAPVLAYAVSAPEGVGNGFFVRQLDREGAPASPLHQAEKGSYTHPVWARDASHLAFVVSVLDDENKPGDAEIWMWRGDGEAGRMVSCDDAPNGWMVPSKNELRWSRDGQRLFFGFKPIDENAAGDGKAEDEESDPPFDPYDFEALLDQREVDVWHWNDPRIIPNQKERWEEHEENRVYRAVVHLESGDVVPLADLEVPQVEPSDNPRFAFGASDVPYLKELTWNGQFTDLYVVDLKSGERQLVVRRITGRRSYDGSMSPDGRFVVFYKDGDWHLYDAEKRELENVTAGLGVPFANEDHDYPMDPPGYGLSEWLADSSAVFVYDKSDIWRVPTDGGEPKCLTTGEGRKIDTVFRVIDLDPEEETIAPDARLLLEAYHDLEKHDALYSINPAGGELRRLYGTGKHSLEIIARAEITDRILFTRERYDEFPNLWTSTVELEEPTRLTDANPQIADFAWGSAELVEWSSADGIPLQGILIKPGNYEPGKRYPVLVYYYRFFSQRLNLFNEPVVNHRPSFPLYASNGYAVFLPDIRFEIGQPGFSATKCLVPGVQKLVDMGVADADAIGLHGHSWSGYQTAFVITQTDIFAAAVAGAPVSNMTSAYSGIRWGTGLARQFQYEKSQSRIGGSLWEKPELYIENSPVFFADRIETPLLIQFGDEDGAVPWYQGIELYLACRRLEKNCIMLQYRGEPHHLKKYANKLDYSIKMKEFFDHWLMGEPAPAWITEGVAFRGE
jgi:dipeptidyl aminopeptidase/acylaminoacyl peptidase